MVVVGESWRLWVVMVVVCVSHGGCVCESREVSKDAIICQQLQTSKANLGMVRSQEDRRFIHRL